MIWRNVLKRAFLSLLPIAIIPIGLGVLVILRFGLTIDAVLIIVMLAQFYIIWIQADVSLRQNRLSELTYEPTLSITVEETNDPQIKTLKLRNTGNYPAFNTMAQNIDQGERDVDP